MTRQNRQAPGARGIPEPSKRRAGERTPQNKAAAAQLKTDRLARSLKQPVARPAHGPSMTTKAVQAKMASGVVSPRARIAPPVYRPQPIPKVLQTKSSSGQSQQTGQTQRQPVAPPVYRPEARKIAQPKAITPQRKLPTAPAINPQRIKSVVQRKPASATDTGRLAKSPPVQRPAQMRGGGQTKTAGSLVSKKPPFAPPFCGAPQKVVQAYGTLNIQNDARLSTEDEVTKASPEEFVIVARGITPTQRSPGTKDVKRGLFVSLPKMMRTGSDVNAKAPEDDTVQHYVKQNRDAKGVQDLIEFTTDVTKMKGFALESNLGYVMLVKIQKKYLTSSRSMESGWMARQDAPYEIVTGRKYDKFAGVHDQAMSSGNIQEALQDELDAHFFLTLRPEEISPEQKSDLERYKQLLVKYLRAAKTERRPTD